MINEVLSRANSIYSKDKETTSFVAKVQHPPVNATTGRGRRVCQAVAQLFPRIVGNPDYASIIHQRHLVRLRNLLQKLHG